MIKLKLTIKLYSYKELKGEAKEKAFNEHKDFLENNPATYEDEDEDGNIITKYDNMQEWTEKEIKEYVEDSININEYLFFKNGEMADTILYTGKHERSGQRDFFLNGEVYKI